MPIDRSTSRPGAALPGDAPNGSGVVIQFRRPTTAGTAGRRPPEAPIDDPTMPDWITDVIGVLMHDFPTEFATPHVFAIAEAWAGVRDPRLAKVRYLAATLIATMPEAEMGVAFQSAIHARAVNLHDSRDVGEPRWRREAGSIADAAASLSADAWARFRSSTVVAARGVTVGNTPLLEEVQRKARSAWASDCVRSAMAGDAKAATVAAMKASGDAGGFKGRRRAVILVEALRSAMAV